MNLVVVAPHPDDESIGCGGLICTNVAWGDRVTAVFLTSGELGLKEMKPEDAVRCREAEADKAAAVLGLSETVFLREPDWFVGSRITEAAHALWPVLEREAPELILVPHALEEHPDHAAAISVVRAALARDPLFRTDLWLYEVWTPMTRYDVVHDITPVFSTKLRAVRSYESQLMTYSYDEAVEGLNRFRGALAGHTRYAEVFGTVRGAED